jgi:hypothetical protein
VQPGHGRAPPSAQSRVAQAPLLPVSLATATHLSTACPTHSRIWIEEEEEEAGVASAGVSSRGCQPSGGRGTAWVGKRARAAADGRAEAPRGARRGEQQVELLRPEGGRELHRLVQHGGVN